MIGEITAHECTCTVIRNITSFLIHLQPRSYPKISTVISRASAPLVAIRGDASSGDYGISLTSSVTSFEVEFFVSSDFYRSELIASSPSVKEELANIPTLRVEVQSQRVT